MTVIKYKITKGIYVDKNTSFEQKRQIVKKLKYYAQGRSKFANPLRNALRLGTEKTNQYVFIKWLNGNYPDEFIEKWFGMILAVTIALPFYLVYTIVALLTAVVIFPKAYCDSQIIKRFGE